jgi:hypothetical protein
MPEWSPNGASGTAVLKGPRCQALFPGLGLAGGKQKKAPAVKRTGAGIQVKQ